MNYALMTQYTKAGKTEFKKGNTSQSEKLFRAALREAELDRLPNEYTARQYELLGVFYFSIGHASDAEFHLKKALELHQTIHDPENIAIAKTHFHLGLLYQVWGRLDEAEHHYQHAIKIEKRAQLLESPQTNSQLFYQSLHALSTIHCAQQHSNCSQSQSCRQTYTTLGKVHSLKGRDLIMDLHELALRYCEENRHDEAKKVCTWILDSIIERMERHYLGHSIPLNRLTIKKSSGRLSPTPVVESFTLESDDTWRPSVIFRPKTEPFSTLPDMHSTFWNQRDMDAEEFVRIGDNSWRPGSTNYTHEN